VSTLKLLRSDERDHDFPFAVKETPWNVSRSAPSREPELEANKPTQKAAGMFRKNDGEIDVVTGYLLVVTEHRFLTLLLHLILYRRLGTSSRISTIANDGRGCTLVTNPTLSAPTDSGPFDLVTAHRG
jgi:hypothetical protein